MEAFTKTVVLVLVLVLVLDQRNPATDRSKTEPMFDHEKLDAYRLSIAFVAWAVQFSTRNHDEVDRVF